MRRVRLTGVEGAAGIRTIWNGYVSTCAEIASGGGRRIGLSLEPRRAPLEVVVVDSVLRTPTDN